MVETDINKRWEQGIEHHPKSLEMFDVLKDADHKYGEDYFYWRSGGDGDNGETLMFTLDVYFELKDQTEGARP